MEEGEPVVGCGGVANGEEGDGQPLEEGDDVWREARVESQTKHETWTFEEAGRSRKKQERKK